MLEKIKISLFIVGVALAAIVGWVSVCLIALSPFICAIWIAYLLTK